MSATHEETIDTQIALWRDFMRRRRTVHNADVDELEDHLRSQIDELHQAGLTHDEAFLVAVKRMGNLDSLSREFAREHSDRLWKQLVLPGTGSSGDGRETGDGGTDLAVVLVLALGAGLATALLAQTDESWIIRLVSLTTLPFVAGYFAWKRRLETRVMAIAGGVFVAAAAAMAWLPFNDPDGQTEELAALHLPIALWFVVGLAYVAGRWRDPERRMDFVRFTGETVIYYALIGLGGGVLIAVTFGVFNSIDLDIDLIIGEWVLPAGMAGALLVAAWLVEAKQGVIESMAPVLTRIFTPLFTFLFVVFLATVVLTGRGLDVGRDLLIIFDLLLVVVLGLVLYSISARDPEAGPGWFDYLQLALIVSALAIDVLGLVFILARISEFGFSPNKTAALGENLILLVNLAGAAWLYLHFIRGRARFKTVERWQTRYMVVYPIWAASVVVVFPLLFITA
ncbi:MAG: permease prefix domain 1-containing protein [Acidimicrobiia bacterium]|nr:permease prefix domain 1-containing protein [Acidimicrobiia bacterium]